MSADRRPSWFRKMTSKGRVVEFRLVRIVELNENGALVVVRHPTRDDLRDVKVWVNNPWR